eukprot:CAMPEP_0172535634 /NCGR_PEP_ID=MMETSP1067-20121228/7551_1 /TAXON_ID=265564 ORGANISM="Thalassiosira punctigera, Strain Tpunct2005C2" /NCGR_SAMPLE_ID=MMETSP1067 /ASSEMBLY_ACC=CAM_ASM_000444 /LENGTH=533 /DNA_ID=CAMNT_0013320573 /DNA_START=75 /DNA_END=1676 /DNA_ORIENTATION=-
MKLPQGINKVKEGFSRAREISCMDFNGGYVNGRRHKNTFAVEAMHQTLPNSSGVRFNVETVPEALEEDLHKDKLCREEILSSIKKDAAAFYDNDAYSKNEDIRLEALSNAPDTTVFCGGSGFLAACLTAFARHLPLALSPDHVWVLLSYAFAKHVDKHAEELRGNFVQHEGKKRLEVIADHMVMGGGNLTIGSGPETWEATIFPDFSRQIKEHIGEKVHGTIASDFTTTTNTARAAHEITLMSAMKNYFSYGMSTLCGIPSITLLGSEEDWVALRARAEDLGRLMTREVRDAWLPHLLQVLDEFVKSYKGNVNHGFWQSMVKLRDTGGGSGSHSFISGWAQILFPYHSSGNFNSRLKPWTKLYFEGPEPSDFPTIVSSAPVDWDYYGKSHDLHFHSGITGFTQDPNDGTLTPLIGWYVTHDPNKDPDVRLEEVKGEIEALLKGHRAEARATSLNKEASWYTRVCTLHTEQLSLEGPARRIVLKRKRDGVERYGDDYFAIEHEMRCLNQVIEKENKRSNSVDEMIRRFFNNSQE